MRLQWTDEFSRCVPILLQADILRRCINQEVPLHLQGSPAEHARRAGRWSTILRAAAKFLRQYSEYGYFFQTLKGCLSGNSLYSSGAEFVWRLWRLWLAFLLPVLFETAWEPARGVCQTPFSPDAATMHC